MFIIIAASNDSRVNIIIDCKQKLIQNFIQPSNRLFS
ncbi:hypothetical protein WwAna0338, partial [Wolbachia endosymbiont of Drosophila ananassae]